MSLSRIYKNNGGIDGVCILPVELNQVNSMNSGTPAVAQKAISPPRPQRMDENSRSQAKPLPGTTYEDLDRQIDRLAKEEKRFQEATQALASALEEIGRLRKSILANSTDDMLRLVLVLSEQVIRSELKTDSEIIVRIIQQALHSAIKSDAFHIKVNPDDFELVNERKPLFLASISGMKNITFEADPEVARGGCLVESDLGQVDATLEVRLNEIREQLLHSVNGKNGTSG